eukprot:SAG31_NODE_675_length_12908_cov_11.596612_9_plen_377_part_00
MLGLHIAVVTDRAAVADPARAAGAVPELAAGAGPHRAAAMRRPRSHTQLRNRALARVSLISVVAHAAVLRLLLAKDCHCRLAAGAVRAAGHLLRRGCRRGRGRVRAHTQHHCAGARRGAAPYRTRRAAAVAGRESRQSAIRRLLLVARGAAEPSMAVAHRVVEQVNAVAAGGAARCTTALVYRVMILAVRPVILRLARAGVAVVVVCILRGADTVVDTWIRAAWIRRIRVGRRPILVAGESVPPCKACALEAKVRVAAPAVAVARVRGAVVPRVILLAVRTAVVRCALATVAAEKIGARPSVQAGLPTAHGGRLLLAVRLRLPTTLHSVVQRLAVIASVVRRALALRLHFSKNTVGPAGPSMLARVRRTHLLVPSA